MKGKFKPSHPEKYIGDPTSIMYRSSWEFALMGYLDKHPSVLRWSSEEIVIPYFSPIDGKKHRYFPDFFVHQKNKEGLIEKLIIEVKPEHQTKPPTLVETTGPKGKISKAYINAVKTYGVNQAKWKAAEFYCKERGWKFIKLTEKNLFG
jgi:hypothetical protein